MQPKELIHTAVFFRLCNRNRSNNISFLNRACHAHSAAFPLFNKNIEKKIPSVPVFKNEKSAECHLEEVISIFLLVEKTGILNNSNKTLESEIISG
jgi:hypothetical protein